MSHIHFEPILPPLAKDTNNQLPFFILFGSINDDTGNVNWHRNLEFYYIANGSGKIYYNNGYIDVKQGDFCIINPYIIHSLTSDSIMDIVNICVDNDFFKHNYIDIENYTYQIIIRDKSLRRKLSKIVNIYVLKKDNEFFMSEICHYMVDFVLFLTKRYGKKNKYNTSDPILFALGYIRSNYTRKITLDEIAEQACISKHHLARLFKKKIGYTIIQYINTLKCQQACQYLTTYNYAPLDVCNMLNFNSYDYFLKTFKKYIGQTPSEYRKQQNLY